MPAGPAIVPVIQVHTLPPTASLLSWKTLRARPQPVARLDLTAPTIKRIRAEASRGANAAQAARAGSTKVPTGAAILRICAKVRAYSITACCDDRAIYTAAVECDALNRSRVERKKAINPGCGAIDTRASSLKGVDFITRIASALDSADRASGLIPPVAGRTALTVGTHL